MRPIRAAHCRAGVHICTPRLECLALAERKRAFAGPCACRVRRQLGPLRDRMRPSRGADGRGPAGDAEQGYVTKKTARNPARSLRRQNERSRKQVETRDEHSMSTQR